MIYKWRGPGSLIYDRKIYRAGDEIEISKEDRQIETIKKLIDSGQLYKEDMRKKK